MKQRNESGVSTVELAIGAGALLLVVLLGISFLAGNITEASNSETSPVAEIADVEGLPFFFSPSNSAGNVLYNQGSEGDKATVAGGKHLSYDSETYLAVFPETEGYLGTTIEETTLDNVTVDIKLSDWTPERDIVWASVSDGNEITEFYVAPDGAIGIIQDGTKQGTIPVDVMLSDNQRYTLGVAWAGDSFSVRIDGIAQTQKLELVSPTFSEMSIGANPARESVSVFGGNVNGIEAVLSGSDKWVIQTASETYVPQVVTREALVLEGANEKVMLPADAFNPYESPSTVIMLVKPLTTDNISLWSYSFGSETVLQLNLSTGEESLEIESGRIQFVAEPQEWIAVGFTVDEAGYKAFTSNGLTSDSFTLPSSVGTEEEVRHYFGASSGESTNVSFGGIAIYDKVLNGSEIQEAVDRLATQN